MPLLDPEVIIRSAAEGLITARQAVYALIMNHVADQFPPFDLEPWKDVLSPEMRAALQEMIDTQ